MKVIVFGATGMVGQGVLRECLRDETVDNVLVIGRNSIGQTHPKLRELRRPDMFDFGGVAVELQGYDACFFCLGVSAAGMNEADYTRLTYDLTLGWAKILARANPARAAFGGTSGETAGRWSPRLPRQGQSHRLTESLSLCSFPAGGLPLWTDIELIPCKVYSGA